jgi:ADP-ribosylglycohydrolase
MVDPNTRLEQISRCLNGLSIGDCLGHLLFTIPDLRHHRRVPEGIWTYTDDTRMALAIAHNLAHHGAIAQDELAKRFAEDFIAQPERGYGAVAHFILHRIASGIHWKQASTLVYSGTGSKGNGGAMRATVVGAYFFDDLSLVVQQGIKATELTHAHSEGKAGAVAVAVAAALAVRVALKQCAPRSEELFSQVIDYTPPGQVRLGLQRAAELLDASPRHAGDLLGTGVQVLAEDTVPFALWCALTTLHNYENALWKTFDALEGPESDSDTLGAIVGGIVGLSGYSTIPAHWRQRSEAVDFGQMGIE